VGAFGLGAGHRFKSGRYNQSFLKLTSIFFNTFPRNQDVARQQQLVYRPPTEAANRIRYFKPQTTTHLQ
jgi:hypothetical protein